MKLTKLNENKTLAEYEKEWEEQNGKTCDNCGTKLNDGGTCPKCDDGEEDSLRESADFSSGETIAMIDISGSMQRFIQTMGNKAEALGANKVYYFADSIGTDPNENLGSGSDFFEVLEFIDAHLDNKFIIFTDSDIKPFISRINKNYPNVKLVFFNSDYDLGRGVFTDTLKEGMTGTNSEEFDSYAAAIERHKANGTEKELDAVITSAYNDLNRETRLTGPEFNKLCDLANLPDRKIAVREAYDPQEFNPDATGPIYDMNVQFYNSLEKAIKEERWEDAAKEYCEIKADLDQELQDADRKPIIGKLFKLFAKPHLRTLDNYKRRIPAEYLNDCDKKNENLTESTIDKFYIDEIVSTQGGKTENERHSFDTIEELKKYVKDANLTPDDVANCGKCDIKDLFECGSTDTTNEALGVGAGLALGGAAIGAGMIGSSLLDSMENEDDDAEELNELLDIEIDAKGFGGSGNNVHVGPGSMPLTASLDRDKEEKRTRHYGKDYDDEFTLMGY